MRTLSALPAIVVCCIGLLTACGTATNSSADDEPNAEAATVDPSAPADPNDAFQSLQVNMVAPSGTHFPDGVDGVEFGCADTLVTIDTVPIETGSPDDHVAAAIEFLLNDSQYYHGSPAVTNSLTLSETLELDSVEVSRSTAEITMTGDVVARGECEAYRIQAQLYGTVAATADVDDVSITVDDTELNEVLGLEPFDTGELTDHDD